MHEMLLVCIIRHCCCLVPLRLPCAKTDTLISRQAFLRDAAVKAEVTEGQEDEGLSAAGSRRSGRARTQAASFDPSPPKPASEGKPSIKRKAFFMSKEEKAKLAEELAEIEAQQAAARAREEEEARKMRSIAMQQTLRREKEMLRQDNLRVSEGKSVNSLFL